jgi:outer membrane lipoprotein
MTHSRFLKFLLAGLFLFLISGCAYPISKELRHEASKELTFQMVLQNPTAYVGSIVIWGGKIIETRNTAEGSEVVVLEIPLDYQEMPESEKYSQGRFIAKSSTLLDPEVYRKGKKITVAGEIVGRETKPLGKTEYTYPVITIKQIHLWRKVRVYPYPPSYYYWYGPYYGPYGWYGRYGPYGPWPYDYDYDYDFDDED